MKIALAQQNYHIGNFEYNRNKIIEGILWAKQKGADLVVFPELCICGYPPRDFLEFNDFINSCCSSIDEIKQFADTIGVIIGAPSRNKQKEGKELFNAAYLLYDKEIKAEIHKTLLPNYDIFDENRYFEPANEWNVISFKGKKLAVTICEDIWNMGDNPLYRITPMEKLMLQQPDVMINVSASPFNVGQDIVRNSIVKAHTVKYKIPMLYCNAVGAQTEIIFDGGSLVYDGNGNKVFEMKYFEEDYQLFDISQFPKTETTTINSDTTYFYSTKEIAIKGNRLDYLTNEKNILEIRKALALGMRDYFSKMNFSTAILGASGGIDSAVTQVLAVEALGKENVSAILMPSEFSTNHSVTDATQLSINLECRHEIISITTIFDAILKELKPIFKDLPFDVTEENAQARIRGTILMAMANKFGSILLNTSNKSELATGYGTLYGDMAGGISVLGDLYKTQIYALAKLINSEKEIIPHSIITKAPSAELRHNQKDSDSLPEYSILDTILYEYIELRKSPNEIIAQGFENKLVSKILNLVNHNEYKRNQFCPILRVSNKSFGTGRRMPIVGKYLM